ncbi:COG3014 family protein [Pseudoalteromonas mariniglutinosa]|uniref:COG3014 family protein n=1 Tax=Pseudoalteromonas mariniglutinosa TaxID=206042 RepID=UPI00384A902A
MQRGVIIVLILLLPSCSTISLGDLFQDYASQLKPVRQAINDNDLTRATQQLPHNSQFHSNYLLNQLERARIAYLSKQSAVSQHGFEDVYRAVENKRQSAKIQLSAGLEQSNALLTNDAVISYLPAAYEMTMLHSYKALSYIFDNNLEAALVEVRRANKVQVDELTANQADIDKQVQRAAENFPSMTTLIGDIKHGFQNAFTFYLSAILYEANKQFDDAYIDYKKALEINANNPYLQQTVLQLAKQQGFEQDYNQFTKRFAEAPSIDNQQGQVVVIIEQGLVPSKAEFTLRLPIYTSQGDARFYSLALPIYNDVAFEAAHTHIQLNDHRLALIPLVKLESLAAKTLETQSPSRIARQLLRLAAKEKMRAELARTGGDVGNILANLYNLASEQADTRSWLTLPNQIAVARTALSSGQHRLTLPGHQTIDFTVSKQRLTFVFLTSINHYFDHHVVQL